MTDPVRIEVDKRRGNLHIRVVGLFTPEVAARVTTIMVDNYNGQGNIFVRTGRIREVTPDSGFVFKMLIDSLGLPKNKIYFTGEKGLKISHDGGRVIIFRRESHGSAGCG